MTGDAPIAVGVVGLGFMGRTHLAAYASADRAGFANRVVAVADRNADKREGRADSGGNLESGSEEVGVLSSPDLARYATPDELLADPAVELVSICTPTDTHADLAARALLAGKHVLVEKPVAHEPERIERLAREAERSGRHCMPAMCMRFWPGWSELAAAIAEGRHGALRSARFVRKSARPGWSPQFYGDAARTGGALGDLHVHDADFVRFALGEPVEVSVSGHVDELVARYRIVGREEVPVSAEASWELGPDDPFVMRYTVELERATWDFDLDRERPLEVRTSAGVERPLLGGETGYELEVRDLLARLARGTAPSCGLSDAARTARLLAAERESLSSGRSVALSA